MNQKKAIKQLKTLNKIVEKGPRLAAEGWEENWQTLIAIMLSAQTRDSKTIPICEGLFKRFDSVEKIAKAKISSIEKEIKSINYYKTKAKHIKETAKIIFKKGLIEEFEELIQLPGVGRKTANVFLVAMGKGNHIGVDTHVFRISHKLGWSKGKTPEEVEKNLMKLFPKRYWNSINNILVSFGQTHGRSQSKENEILKEVRKLKA